jgi:muconolactone delta-isomerase
MKRILVDITSNLNQVPNLQQILPQELAAANRLKEQGILEHVFVKSAGIGAILIFKDIEEQGARQLVSTLPLAPYFGSTTYTIIEKHF